ncbi:MAG: hypothetical protein ACAH80_00210 [Alphaproteobacteria bacterium]
MPTITDPKRLLEAEAETAATPANNGKIKLNFARISKNTVETMARQSLYIHRSRTPDGSPMPDPVEKVGKMKPGRPRNIPGIA